MPSKLPRFLIFFVTCAMVLREWIEVLVKNSVNTQDFEYVLNAPVKVGAVALGVVGLSVFLKRNIWAYLFFLVLIASFSPLVEFSKYSFALYIGSLKLDLIAIPLLTIHVLLNIHLVRAPELTKKQEEETTTASVSFFERNLESKSDEELLRMDESDLLPEATEARAKILTKRGLKE